MKREYLSILLIVIGLAGAALITRASESVRPSDSLFSEEPLYLNETVMKRATLSFNGLAADYYWICSLQYIGRKIVAYEDTHEGRFDMNALATLDLRLLPSLLKMSVALDPHFMQPYFFGAVILPELNSAEAIALLNQGIAMNPDQWRLHQHLGYIYWQRREFAKASGVYGEGSKRPGAPAWMAAMSARMKAEGGSRDAAREMYRHLYEESTDQAVKDMVAKQIMRLDSLDQQDFIKRALNAWAARSARCPSAWSEVSVLLRQGSLSLDPNTLAPLDPSGVPYRLAKNGCDVELDEKSKVPHR
jgi:tetratricopeptide (TPR) repeat protein